LVDLFTDDMSFGDFRSMWGYQIIPVSFIKLERINDGQRTWWREILGKRKKCDFAVL